MSGPPPQVVVVGAGPVGLVLAGLLGAQGVRVLILERERQPHGEPRAIAADDVMLRVLSTLPGLDQAIGQMLGPVPVRLEDGRGRRITDIDFGITELGRPGLAFFHQPTLERALHASLAGMPAVTIRRGVEVTGLTAGPDGIAVTLASGELLSSGYVVGCDGAGSTVRRLLGLGYPGRTAPQRWLVVDADTDRPLRDWFTYRLDPARPAVSLPRPGGHRWEFMLRPGEEPAALTHPPALRRLLAPDVTPEDLRVLRATVYTFHTRMAARWRQGRALLAGDAAHCMPPFAGHGLGAGVRDAAALAWRLADVVSGRSGAATLDAYEAERRPDVRAMTRTALIAGTLLQTTSRPCSAAIRALPRGVDAAPVAGRWFRAGGLRPRPRLAGAGRGPRRRPLPNPVVHVAGHPCRLDRLLGAGWALLVEPGDGRVPEVLNGREFVRLSVSGRPEAAVHDLDGGLVALLNRAGGTLIVRPDRYLA